MRPVRKSELMTASVRATSSQIDGEMNDIDEGQRTHMR